MKISALIITLLIHLLAHVQFGYAQINHIENKIYVERDSIQKKTSLVFHNGNKMLLKACAISISPDSESVAIIKFAGGAQKETELEIYDEQGGKKKTFTVDALGLVVLANDGRFVVYGAYPTEDIANYRLFSFYNSNGVKNSIKIDSLGTEVTCKFSSQGIFLILAEPNFLARAIQGKLALYIFDKNFKLKGKTELNNLDKRSGIKSVSFDDEEKEVTIEIESYNKSNGSKYKRSLKYDTNANLKKIKEEIEK
jgi:hypothetical protein